MLRIRPYLELLLLAALSSCGAPVPPSAPPSIAAPIAAPATASAVKPPAPAPSYVVRGTLLGHDGKPMKLAHVHVGDQSTQVDANGSFRLTATGPGFLPIRATGVDHADLAVSLYFDGHETDVEITLGTYERRAPPFADASVVVCVRPEGGGTPTPLHFPRPVKKLASGLYGAVLLDDKDEIFYALDDVARNHRVNGAEAESFLWDGRSYLGQLHRGKGAFRVVLDPAKMPPAGLRPRLRFAHPESRAARITSLRFDAALRATTDDARGPHAQQSHLTARVAQALTQTELSHELRRDKRIFKTHQVDHLVGPMRLDGHAQSAVTPKFSAQTLCVRTSQAELGHPSLYE